MRSTARTEVPAVVPPNQLPPERMRKALEPAVIEILDQEWSSLRESRWEQVLAENWLVWLGGIALALGGAFLVKLSIDYGLLTPAARRLSSQRCSGLDCASPLIESHAARGGSTPTEPARRMSHRRLRRQVQRSCLLRSMRPISFMT